MNIFLPDTVYILRANNCSVNFGFDIRVRCFDTFDLLAFIVKQLHFTTKKDFVLTFNYAFLNPNSGGFRLIVLPEIIGLNISNIFGFPNSENHSDSG